MTAIPTRPLERFRGLFNFGLSFILVALGQPCRSNICSIAAAICGYFLFWHCAQHKTFLKAFLWQLAVALVQLSWMSAHKFQGYYIFLVWIFLAALCALSFALFSKILRQYFSKNILAAFFFAGLWALFEWARQFPLCGFMWNPAGLSLTGNYYSLQLASVGGIYLLSYVVILTNLLLLQKRIVSALICASLPYCFGLMTSQEKPVKEYCQVAIVQPGFLPSHKILVEKQPQDYLSAKSIFSEITTLVASFDMPCLDLIVLPEGMFVGVNPLRALGCMTRADVISGLERNEGGRFFQTAGLISEENIQTQLYDKRVLLPIAEYLPFAFLQGLAKNYGVGGFYTRGKASPILHGKKNYHLAICYEELFPKFFHGASQNGSNMLVHLINDSWFYPSLLAKQHRDHARIRAVEQGLPLVRACMHGESGVYNCYGRQIAGQKEMIFQPNVSIKPLLVQVPLQKRATVFAKLGENGVIVLIFLQTFFTALFLSKPNFLRYVGYSLQKK